MTTKFQKGDSIRLRAGGERLPGCSMLDEREIAAARAGVVVQHIYTNAEGHDFVNLASGVLTGNYRVERFELAAPATEPAGVEKPVKARTEEAADIAYWGIPRLGKVSFDGRFIAQMKATGNVQAFGDAFAHEVGRLVRALPKPPGVEELARAMFESDPDVRRFIHETADATLYDPKKWDVTQWDERTRRAIDIAWERNERGWRDDCECRAKEILHRLTKKPGP